MMTSTVLTQDERQPARDRDPFAGRQYRWWWAMTICMSLSVGIALVTVPSFVLARTDVRFFVALAVLCQTVPTALFTLVGGAAADRFGRTRVLMVSLIVTTVASFGFVAVAVAGVQPLWPVLAIAAVLGAAAAFQNPARQSLINRLAPGTRLQNGVIWGTLAFIGGQSFLGPAVGGLAVARFGLTAGFVIEALLLVAALVCLTRMGPVQEAGGGVSGSLFGQIAAGLRYVRATPRVWQVLTLGMVPGLCFIGVAQAANPIFATDTFGAGPAGIGLLSAGMGIGTLAGSSLLVRWGPRGGRGRWFLWALPVGGLAYVLVGLAPSLPLAVVALAGFGLSAAIFIHFASTLLQTYAEPAYIGRVLSVYSLCVLGAVPLGNLHAGLGLELADPRVVYVYSGALAAAVGMASFVLYRAARALD
jgi:MFS family permease